MSLWGERPVSALVSGVCDRATALSPSRLGKEGEEIVTKTAGVLEEEDVMEFARRVGFEADERQAEVLRSKAKRGILNCTRQWGKSTVSAVKAVHRAWTERGSLVLVASPGLLQSGEWMRKAEEVVEKLGVRVRGDGKNEMSVELPNGSRIVGLPGTEKTVRGFSAVSMLIIDEAARVEDAMYEALRPMLAVGGGDLWMMSTPFGKRGFFYETWELGGEAWHRVRVAAAECGRIERGFLEGERGSVEAGSFAQEYQCSFVENGMTVFGREMVEAALTDEVEPLEITEWKWGGENGLRRG